MHDQVPLTAAAGAREAVSVRAEDLTDVAYPVVERFYTVQGEGAWSGYASFFIRLAGCDVGCTWCDTKYSWERSSGIKIDVARLLEEVRATPAPIVVVTGGEPTLHNLEPLARALRRDGRRAHLETSGAHPIAGEFDWITLSPKRFKPPVESAVARADELKVVVLTQKDLLWAERFAEKVGPNTRLFLQPEWSTPASIPLILEYVKANPQWQISLQIHKFLQIP